MLHVCPLSRLGETVERVNAERVVSLLADGTALIRPASIRPEHHLLLSMHDIVDAAPDMTLPGLDHVQRLIEFALDWNRSRPTVVHCYAGISRSTAAAYIMAATLLPNADEFVLARALRRASPSATPNRRLVALADEVLGRNGRMVSAVEAIGRGAEAFEGTPFELRID